MLGSRFNSSISLVTGSAYSNMIVAALNEANRKVDEAMKGKLGGMLPPGLGGLLG